LSFSEFHIHSEPIHHIVTLTSANYTSIVEMNLRDVNINHSNIFLSKLWQYIYEIVIWLFLLIEKKTAAGNDFQCLVFPCVVVPTFRTKFQINKTLHYQKQLSHNCTYRDLRRVPSFGFVSTLSFLIFHLP
jgi:hypothetical protein